MPSSVKAMSIVISRPMWSETQPKNGRVNPFSTRSIVNANVSAGSVNPMMLTGTSAILKSLAIGASCATAIKPPAATSTNISVHDPEHRLADDLERPVVALRLDDARGAFATLAVFGKPACSTCADPRRCDHHHDEAMRDPEIQERGLVAHRLDDRLDRHARSARIPRRIRRR